MKKILLVAALLTAFSAVGQTVRLDSNPKCDATSRVALLRQSQTKGGAATEVKLLAEVNERFDANALRAKGITVGVRAGHIVTLRLPMTLLDQVDQCPDIVGYSVARPLYPHLNKTRVDTRTDSVQAGYGLPQAYTGQGVLVGITDWGFDYMHINYNNKGRSNFRLLRAWDQFRLSGPAPTGFDYGTVFNTRDELKAAGGDTANIYDYGTHGTHVAGIAAGRGIDDKYIGQAPDANLLFATFMLDEYSWLDAVEWMWQVSKEEQKRLVINSSWGMYTLGPIDGTSYLSQALNSYSDSGIVFVTSAGNCGDDLFHISRTFTADSADTLRTVAEYYGASEIGQALILWGEPGKSCDVSFAMVRNGEPTQMRWISTSDGDRYLDSALVAGNDSTGYDTLHFNMTVEQSCRFNQRPHVLINVDKNPNYLIHLFVTATDGTVHAWNVCNLSNGAGNMGCAYSRHNLQGYSGGDNISGIGEPAAAANCIAVAAHRAETRKPDGSTTLGGLTTFSSQGPVIDGRNKPEISAPGANVISSISSYTTSSYSSTMSYSYNGRTYIWAAMSGTSMSSPAVTGIVALLLQANPALTSAEVREILCRTARNDEMTGPLHERDSISDRWGWGKVDAMAAINEALARVDIQTADEEFFAKSLQLYPNPAATQVTILTGRHTPERVTLYSIEGRPVLEQEITMEGVIDLSHLARGVYIVRCGARTARLVH